MKQKENPNPKNNDAKSPFRIDPSILPVEDNQGNIPDQEIVKPFVYTGEKIPPGNK